MKYTFYTEDGVQELEYEEYCMAPELMNLVKDKTRVNLFLGRRIFSYSRDYLRCNPVIAQTVDALHKEATNNPLQFFLPNCAKVGLDSPSHQFINDLDHQLTVILAGNRFGKSTINYIKCLTTYGVIPCDPEWMIFKEHGVEYREWTGPKQMAIVTYELIGHMNTIWPQVVQQWTPKAELGSYARGEQKSPNWRGNPHVQLKCGSEIYFLYCSQSQAPFESQALDLIMWDEQGLEEKFDGANERLATRRGYHSMSMTPHRVEGRPDTGAGGWIHKMYQKELTKGLSIKFYKGNLIDESPDWIYPEQTKTEKIYQWVVEPAKRRDKKKEREGRSRLYGDFHVTSGLVYDDFDREIHVIDPFPIPDTWTGYRAIDHGRRNPMACLCSAVNPYGEVFIFREYLVPDKIISQHVKSVIEMCGNKRMLSEHKKHDERSGMIFDQYEEKVVNEYYRSTVMDSRSFARPLEGCNLNISDMYRMSGLRTLPAQGKDLDHSIPIVREWFAVDPSRKHWVTKEYGAPRVYIFSTCRQLVGHIEQYVNEEVKGSGKNPTEKPRRKDDHDLDAMRYLLQIPPRFVDGCGIGQGDVREVTEDEEIENLGGGRIIKHKPKGGRGDKYTRY